MTYLKEKNVSKRALAMLLSLLMIFSMFSMLTSFTVRAENKKYLWDGSKWAGSYSTQYGMGASYDSAKKEVKLTNRGYTEGNNIENIGNWVDSADYHVIIRARSDQNGAQIGIALTGNMGANMFTYANYANVTTEYAYYDLGPCNTFDGRTNYKFGFVIDTYTSPIYITEAYVTDTPPSAGPAAPQNIAAKANGADKIDLTWDAVEGAVNYEVFRSNAADGAYASVGTTQSTSFTDTGLSADTAYFYKVKTVTADGESDLSKPASAKTDEKAPVLTIDSSSDTEVNLSWVYDGAADFNVYRSTDGNNYELITTTAQKSYTDADVEPGTTYYYKVNVNKEAHESFTVGGMDYIGTNERDPQTDKTGNNAFKQDSQQSDGRYNAGYIDNNEWARYEISAKYTGTYNVKVYLANGNDNKATVYLNDEGNKNTPLAQLVDVPVPDHQWQQYAAHDTTVDLKAGVNNIYVVAGSSFNFWKMEFSIDTTATGPDSNVVDVTVEQSASAVINVDSVDNKTAVSGSSFEATAVISNASDYDAAEDVTVTFTIEGTDISSSVTVPASELTSHKTYIAKVQLTAPQAANGTTYQIAAAIDSKHKATGTLTVQAPEIKINSINNPTANAGSPFAVNVEIENASAVDMPAGQTVQVTFNGETQNITLPAIAEGEKYSAVYSTFVAPADAADGQTYPVTASYGGVTLTGTVTVNAPKLEVTGLTSSVTEVTAGTEFTVTAAVVNNGHMDYADGNYVTSFIFNGETVTAEAVTSLAVGETEEVTVTFTAPLNNGNYDVTIPGTDKKITVTVTGGADPDDEDPYPDTPTKDPTTAPDFSVDYAVFVSGPYFIRNNYTGFGYQYLYDSLDNNNYAGKEDGNNGSDNSAYADYGRLRRRIETNDYLDSIQDNQNYMWNIYSKTVGGTTYYMLRNVATGRYMHTGAYTDYYSYNNDNNSANVYAWNAALTNGANGFNGNSNANREMSYYAFTLPSYNNTKGESFTSQIVNQRFAWGQRPLHGELNGDHNTAERRERVFFTSNNEGWGTKNWYFNPANVATTVADLTVTNASADPAEVPFGESMNVSATIKNEGNADIAEGTAILVKFVFNGKLATATYTGGLAAGASADVSASIKPNKLTDGAAMTVTVNADWSIDESDFTNNTYSVENIVVIDNNNPVLSVSSVSDASAAAGETYQVTAVIKNIGKADQTDPFTVNITVNGETQTVNVTDSVAPDAEITVTATFTAPQAANGTKYPIDVAVGSSKKTGTLTVMAPELKVVEITDVTADAETSFQVPVTVKNEGGAKLAAGQTVEVVFNGQKVNVTVPELAAGASATLYAEFTAPEFNGKYKVTAGGAAGTVTVVNGADEDTDPPAPAPSTGDGKITSFRLEWAFNGNPIYLVDDGSNTLRVQRYAAEPTPEANPEAFWYTDGVLKNYKTNRYAYNTGNASSHTNGNVSNSLIVNMSDTFQDNENYKWSFVEAVRQGVVGIKIFNGSNKTNDRNNSLIFLEYFGGAETQANDAAIGRLNNDGIFNDWQSIRWAINEVDLTPADLTVNIVDVSTTDLSIDDTLTAAATIANISDRDITDDIVVKFIFNGKITRVTYKGGLKAGQTAKVEAQLPANKLNEKGSPVNVTVNSDWAIKESDYENNTASSVAVTVRQGVTMIDDFNRDALAGLPTDVMAYEAAKDANGVIENLADSSISLVTTADTGAELYIGRILTQETFSQNNYLVFKIKSSEPLNSGITLANAYHSIEGGKDLFNYDAAENSVTKLIDGYQLVILDLKQFALRGGADEFPYDIFDLSMMIAPGSGTVTIDDIYLTEELPEQPSNAIIEINAIDPSGTPDPVEIEASGSISKKTTTFTMTVTNTGTTDWKNPVINYVVDGKTMTAVIPEGTVIPADGEPYEIEVTIVNPSTEIDEITFITVDDSPVYDSVSVPVKVVNVVVDEDNHGEAPVPLKDTFIIQSEQTGLYLYDDGLNNISYGVGDNVDTIAHNNNIAVARVAAFDGENLPTGNTADELKYQWYLEKQADGNYKITNAYSGRSLVTMSTAYLGENRDDAPHDGEANLIDYVPQNIFEQTIPIHGLGDGFQNDYVFNADSKYWALEALDDHEGTTGTLREGYEDMHVAMFTNNVRYKVSSGDMASYWYYYMNTNMYNSGKLKDGLLNISAQATTGTATYTSTHFYFWHVPKGVDLEMTNVEIYKDGEKVTGAIIKENADDEVSLDIRAAFTNVSDDVIPAGTVIDIKFDFDGKIICVPYTAETDINPGDSITVSTDFATKKLYPRGIPLFATVNADWNESAEEGKTHVHGYDIINETTYNNNTNFDTLIIDIEEEEQAVIEIDFYDDESRDSGSTISLNGKVGPRADEFDIPAQITLTAEPANGYEFVGWYYGGALVYENASVTFTEYSYSSTYLAKFVPAKVKLTVDVSPNNGGTDLGGIIFRKQGEGLLDIPVETYPSVIQEAEKGTSVRLVAKANEGYNFLYWADGQGNKVSENIDYTFTVNEDMTLVAVFMKQNHVSVYFVDSITGKTHYTTTVVAGTTGVAYGGSTPYIDGFRWTGWEVDPATTTFNSDTIIYTTYEKVDERSHTLKVIASSATSEFVDGTNYISVAVALAANATYEITAPDTVADQEFSYWRSRGQVICLDKKFKIQMPDSDCLLEAVYGADDVEKYQTSYCINYEGWITPVDVAGTIQNAMFSLNAACINGVDHELVTKGALLLRVNKGEPVPTTITHNTPGVKVGTVKNNVHINEDGEVYNYGYTDMYAIRLLNASNDYDYYTRAFIIYKDAEGVEHTAYAEDIMNCSTNIHTTATEN